jgi:hypothetical protein
MKGVLFHILSMYLESWEGIFCLDFLFNLYKQHRSFSETTLMFLTIAF